MSESVLSMAAASTSNRSLSSQTSAKQSEFEWELSKENILPLRQGRKVPQLNKTLQSKHSFQQQVALDQQMKHFDQILEQQMTTMERSNDDSSDPLVTWIQYLNWLEEHWPEDTRKKLALLEKCTRQFKDAPKYRNDVRYIRLWIRYADMVSNPKDIFKFLYHNKIGEKVALFYIAWAWVMESITKYAQANDIYERAVKKNAQPQELLKRKLKEFHRRMSRHWLKMSEQQEHNEPGDAQDEDPTSTRRVLGGLHGSDSRFTAYGPNSSNGSSNETNFARSGNKHHKQKPAFKIFNDMDQQSSVADPTTGKWKSFRAAHEMNKENELNPSRWSGTTLQPRDRENVEMAPASHAEPERAHGVPPLEVFVEEEYVMQDVQAAASKAHLNDGRTLRQRLDPAPTEEEELAQKPLKNFDMTRKPPVKTAKRKRTNHDSPQKQTRERLAFHKDLIVSGSGEPICFEEVRAARFPPHRKQTSSSQPKPSFASHVAPQKPQNSNPFVAEINSDIQQQPNGFTVDPGFRTTATFSEKDNVTINTQLAMADVNDMFCSPPKTKPVLVDEKVWDIREENPVERKLHFSVFDDSVDSIPPQVNDQSLVDSHKNDSFGRLNNSFQIFQDNPPEKQITMRENGSARRRQPLGSRDDLVRRTRLTNKDMISQQGRAGLNPFVRDDEAVKSKR